MTPAYASKLGLQIRRTDLGVHKIDGSTLATFGMVLASFQVQDQQEKPSFFQETIRIADTGVNKVLGMPFLALSNTNIQLDKSQLT